MNQWNYVRYRPGKYDFHSWPMFIVYAPNIKDADAQFKAELGTSPAKLPHVGVRWFEIAHVGIELHAQPGDSAALDGGLSSGTDETKESK